MFGRIGFGQIRIYSNEFGLIRRTSYLFGRINYLFGRFKFVWSKRFFALTNKNFFCQIGYLFGRIIYFFEQMKFCSEEKCCFFFLEKIQFVRTNNDLFRRITCSNLLGQISYLIRRIRYLF